MSAELISAAARSSAVATPRLIRSIVGVLADGTPSYAPIGEVLVAEDRVTCHLCGRSFRSVTAHLRAHGWRSVQVAARLGYPTIVSYISDRRANGWTWKAIAAESGQPQTWLRRRQDDDGRTARR